jgi:hypothetical protein
MESCEPAQAAKRDAAYFDQWYEDMATSPARDAIVARSLGLPAAPAGSDAAVRSLQTEGRRSLDTFDSLRRVLATATAP